MGEKIHCDKMHKLFVEADENRDGFLDVEEWLAVCKDAWVQKWLLSQEIQGQDAATLFEMMANGTGNISADDLIRGMSALKGPGATMDIIAQIHNVSRSVEKIQEVPCARHATAN